MNQEILKMRRESDKRTSRPALAVANLCLEGRCVKAVLQRETASRSHKDHAGRFLVEDKLRRGEIQNIRRTRYVVPSSGNFGHSFATHTRDTNVEITIVTDVLSPASMVQRFRDEYEHVRVEVVNKPDETGSHMKERLKLIDQLLRDDPRMRLVDQYSDARIPLAYDLYLGVDLHREFRGEIGGVFTAVGTGGLANGLHQFRERFGLNFEIHAVDADGSTLARPPRHGVRRRLPGYGNGIVTELMSQVRDSMDRWITVEDEEAVAMCHWMQAEHSLSVGPSSGAVLAAIKKMIRWRSHVLPAGELIAILSDGGEPYQETVFNRRWLQANGFSTQLEPTGRRSVDHDRRIFAEPDRHDEAPRRIERKPQPRVW